MMRFVYSFSRCMLALPVLFFAGCGSPALSDAGRAQQSLAILELVPDDAAAVVIVPRLADLDDKPAKLGKVLKAQIPSVLKLAKSMVGLQAGLNEEGSAALVVMSFPGKSARDVSVVGILPVSDYQKLLAPYAPEAMGGGLSAIKPGFAGSVYVAQKGDFAVFVPAENDNRKLIEKIVARAPAVPPSLAASAAWISQQDVAYVITPEGLKGLGPSFREGFQGAVARHSGPKPPQVNQMAEIYELFFSKVEHEISLAAIGLKVGNDGSIRLAGHAGFKVDGEFAKAASQIVTPDTSLLAGLPSGLGLFAGYGPIPPQFAQWVTKFNDLGLKNMLELAGKNLSEEDQTKIAATTNSIMQGFRSFSVNIGAPQPGKALYDQWFSLMRVDDASICLKNIEAGYRQMNAIGKKIDSPMIVQYEVHSGPIDGKDALEITGDMTPMLQAIEQGKAPGMGSKAFFETMFGPTGKMVTRMAAVDQHTIVVAWGDADHLRQGIAAASSPNGGLLADAGVKATLALLPAEAQWKGFINLGGMLAFGQSMAQGAGKPLPIELPEFPAAPPIGVSVQASAQGVDAQCVVPAGVIETIGNYSKQIQQSFARPR